MTVEIKLVGGGHLSLFGNESSLVQVIPYGESPITAEFNISNLEDVIEPLQKACNWK